MQSFMIQKGVSMTVRWSLLHMEAIPQRMIWRFTVADDLNESSKITQAKGTYAQRSLLALQRQHLKNQRIQARAKDQYIEC